MSWYKARAIYEGNGVFSFLPDRQNSSGEDAQPLVDWLNNEAYNYVKQGMRRDRTGTDSNGVFEVDEGKFNLWCSPNSSYGYLYIKAWEEGSEREMEEAPFF